MRTLGIDLAAGPAKTAICLIDWGENRAVATLLGGVADDDLLVDLIGALDGASDKVGIDAPFGWPDPFVEAVIAHRDFAPWPGRDVADQAAYRQTLRLRLTDIDVKQRTGRVPLSVSSDKIGVCAMRLALLLDRLGESGVPTDRAGTGLVAEVYPAAALVVWKLTSKGYKGADNAVVFADLIDRLRQRLPGLEIAAHDAERLAGSDHCFDALISALVARAAWLGQTHRPPDVDLPRVQREGWTHLPMCALSDLMAYEA